MAMTMDEALEALDHAIDMVNGVAASVQVDCSGWNLRRLDRAIMAMRSARHDIQSVLTAEIEGERTE